MGKTNLNFKHRQKNDVIMKIPKKMFISDYAAFESAEFGEIFKAEKDLLIGRSLLAVFTILEKHNPTSFWAPYFGTSITITSQNMTKKKTEIHPLQTGPIHNFFFPFHHQQPFLKLSTHHSFGTRKKESYLREVGY